MNIIRYILLILLVASGAALNAQDTYELQSNSGSIKVTGTSSLHDWEMDVLESSGSARFETEQSKLSGIESIQIKFSSTKIVSGNNIMDKKTRKALKADGRPEIRFKMISADNFKYHEGSFTGSITGVLSIGGHDETIQVPFSGSHRGDLIAVKASQSIALTDFKISPPTAMLGTLKTGDLIEIVFDTEWKNQGSNIASL